MEIERAYIEGCLRNERTAQKALYAQLMPYLNALCGRYLNNLTDRHDVLQETFVRIFTKMHQYDEEKGAFSTWSTRILINTCFTYNTRSKKRMSQTVNIDEVHPAIRPEVIDQMSNEALLSLLKHMPEHNYTVFNLFVIDGFSHKEIADMLGIREDVSRKRLSRAKKWLQKKIPQDKASELLSDVYLKGLL